jgi:hypothetical protein
LHLFLTLIFLILILAFPASFPVALFEIVPHLYFPCAYYFSEGRIAGSRNPVP